MPSFPLFTKKKTNIKFTFSVQGAAFNVTHFESRITRLLYTTINTTEHGQVSQCLGCTKSLTSSIRLGDVLHDGVSVTVNAERYNHMLETFSYLR